jgi:acetyltransferase
MKGTGVARHLMQRLIAWGRVQGLDAITGEVLSENQPMRAFVRKLGFTVRALPDEPDVVEARLDLREPA